MERWGQYAPETRKILLELEDSRMPMTAKRLAAAIDREYVPRRKMPIIVPQETRKYGKTISYFCKECGKEFRRMELSARSKDYCSHKCQLKAERGVDTHDRSGENHPGARLTWDQVDEIRSIYANDQISCQALGDKYGLTKGGIRAIVRGVVWKPENDPRRKQADESSK